MAVPYIDEFWTAAGDFVRERMGPDENVLAPFVFRYRLPRVYPYDRSFEEPGATFAWAILHKGQLHQVARPVLERIARGRAVFANEVFVVWHAGAGGSAIDVSNEHVRAFFAQLEALDRHPPRWTPQGAPRPVQDDGGSRKRLPDMLFDIALHKGRYSDPLSLIPSQAQVYSGNGEDGIIAEIFRRVGTTDRFFVEIGVEDGRQNNSRLLLEQGWRGVWIDSSTQALAQARTTFGDWVQSGALAIVDKEVTRDNVDSMLDTAGVPADFDFLSIDIDQNTGHVWSALRRRARVACIEYNANLPPTVALQAEYDPAQSWAGTSWYGASLKALERIGAAKNMSLVGCELIGVNAFFVDGKEAVGKFRAPFTAEEHYEPPRYGLSDATGFGIGHLPSPKARRWSSS